MGVDVTGFIEVRPWPSWPDLPKEIDWETSVHLDHLFSGRDYDSFGCLFGVMNYANFRPIAANRGLPSDAARGTRKVYEDTADSRSEGLWPTWVGADEIAAIDWDEPAEHADQRLHQFRRDDSGAWQFEAKAASTSEVLDHLGGAEVPDHWTEGDTWEVGPTQYRAVRLTRRQAICLDGPWTPVFEVMSLLGRLHGTTNCRLVVWFDQ